MPGLFDDMVSPEEQRGIRYQNLFGNLVSAGLNAVAAGGSMMDRERAPYLAAAGQALGGMGQQNSEQIGALARQKLMSQQYAQSQQKTAADATLQSLGDKPEFLDAIKQLPPELQTIVPALFRAGRAQEAVTLMDNYRTNQARTTQQQAQADKPPPGYRWTADRTGHEPIPGGMADPATVERLAQVKRALNEKAIPASVTKGMQENLTGIKKIDAALAALEARPESVGDAGSYLQRVMPETGGDINNKLLDPKGANIRALIADIGSLKVHDRSGAAVTASETPRLVPFIPKITDDPQTIRTKLANFKNEYENTMRDMHEYYSADNGFKPYTAAKNYLEGNTQAAPAQPAQQSAPAEKIVGRTKDGREVYIGRDGKQYVR